MFDWFDQENCIVELGFVETVRFDNYLIGSVGKLDRGVGFCRYRKIRCMIGSEGKLDRGTGFCRHGEI